MAELIKSFSYPAHKDRAWSTCFHPTQDILATSSSDLSIKLWRISPSSFSLIHSAEKPHAKTIRSVSWSSCGNYLSSASFDGKTLIWEYSPSEFEPLTGLQGHENEVKCAAWSSDGSFIATCGRDKSVWVWSITEDMEFEIMSVMQEHRQDVKSVAWHPQRNLLASTSYDNSIKIWDYEESCDDWLCKQTLEGHQSTVWKAAFSANGTFLATASSDQSVILWKYVGGAYKLLSKIDVGLIQYSCEFNPFDPTILATCGEAGTVMIFKVENDVLKLIGKYEGMHECDANSLSFSKVTSGLLCSSADDGIINVYSLK